MAKKSESRAWQETREWHPQDIVLRANGFKIHSRPAHGMAIWSRDGELFNQVEALALAKLAGKTPCPSEA